MSNLEDENYSIFWRHCIITHSSITLVYFLIFWVLYYYNYKHNVKPKDRLLISTNVISTIHCVIVLLGSTIAFFYDELYKIDNMMISKNGMLAYVWIFWNSYMLADMIGHTILYLVYDSTKIKRRYDIMIHHIVSYVCAPIIEIPLPIYGWFILVWPPITELSTIFLNLQWFAKFNKWTSDTQKHLQLCFYITWFTVRLPSLFIKMVAIVIFWDDIFTKWPMHSWIAGLTITVTINLLHIVWTVFIIKGICYVKKTKMVKNMCDEIDKPISPKQNTNEITAETKPSHVHGVSIEFN